MFWSKNRKNRYTLANPSFFLYIKVWFKGVYISRTCFSDVIVSVRFVDILQYLVLSSISIHLNLFLFQYGNNFNIIVMCQVRKVYWRPVVC